MRFVRLLVIVCAGAQALMASAQLRRGNIDQFDYSQFPKVSCIFSSYEKESLSLKEFKSVNEAGKPCEFEVASITQDNSSQPLNVLVLWEDMAHNGTPQYMFTKKTLQAFFDSVAVGGANNFSLCTFNRKKNDTPFLNNLTKTFVSDKNQLLQALNAHKQSRERFKDFPNRSDLYTAIREGLELLSKESGAKAVVVFTSGYVMKTSGADSEDQVLLTAQHLHIPVYVVQYNYKSGTTPGVEGFANSTNGEYLACNDAKKAAHSLIASFPQMRNRYFGTPYKVTFTSRSSRGDAAQSLAINIAGKDYTAQIYPPGHNAMSLLMHFWWLVLIIVVLLAVGYYYLRRYIARNRQDTSQLEESVQQYEETVQRLEQEQKQAIANAEQQHQAIVDSMRREQVDAAHRAEMEQLESLMVLKNQYPRLYCEVEDLTFNFEVTKPVIHIGREADNDLVLDHGTVSRHHATLTFNGNVFEIQDNQSLNKVIVNGEIVERAVLRSGDMIGLGNVIIVFNV